MRNYIWDFDTVCALADLEEASYTTCLDLDEVTRALNRLKVRCVEQIREDEELEAVFDAFTEGLDTDGTYVKLYQVKEVVPEDEDFEE